MKFRYKRYAPEIVRPIIPIRKGRDRVAPADMMPAVFIAKIVVLGTLGLLVGDYFSLSFRVKRGIPFLLLNTGSLASLEMTYIRSG